MSRHPLIPILALTALATAGAAALTPRTSPPHSPPPAPRRHHPLRGYPGTPGPLTSPHPRTRAPVHPTTPETYRTLAAAHMRKQRATGDPAYYDRAEAAIRQALALDGGAFESRKLLAWVQAGRHQFEAARDTALACIRERPDDAWSYGILADAETELGEYDRAVAAVQAMLDRKPDLASYSRAAHHRALHGDPEGALELLDLALDCGSPRDPESLAWCWVQKGQVRFDSGDPRRAEADYRQALTWQPGYPLALAGQARAVAALGRRTDAIRLYERALAAVPRPDWLLALAELKRAAGDESGARGQESLARAALESAPPGADRDRALALFLADHGNPGAALPLARRAARSRRDIYTLDALAWVLHRCGRDSEAREASRRARRLGTKDSTLLSHAQHITQALGGSRKS